MGIRSGGTRAGRSLHFRGASRKGARRAALAGMAAFLLGPAIALAQAAPSLRSPAFEVTPFIGQMAGGEFEDTLDGAGQDLDAHANWGIILNALADPGRHYELLYTRQDTQFEGAAGMDVDVQYLQIGGTVSYPEADRIIPYFGLTVGAARFSPDGPGMADETKFAFSVATGVRVPVTERIGVRLDLRAFVTVLGGDDEIFCVSSSGASCRVRTKSDVLTQYAASLGVAIGF